MSKPSLADLLKGGGVYPVVVPLGWQLIDATGKGAPIPEVPGHAFHRILARGALLATETATHVQPEVMTVRRFAHLGPITGDRLQHYTDVLTSALSQKGLEPRVDEQRIGTCALSAEPCGRVIVSRMVAVDGRTEVHYLVRDQKGETWELTYLVRHDGIERWRALFAEIEGPLFASTARLDSR